MLSPFLHTPQQISNSLTTLTELYGDRFELCIGPGDRDQLERVGILFSDRKNIPERLLDAKREIADELRRSGFTIPIWLGAQGPNILKLARFFDGVLLNYAHPDFLSWALKEMGLPQRNSVQMGIYAPSYIYTEKQEEPYMLLRVASAIVALGTSRNVLERFGLYDKVALAKKLEKGLILEDVADKIPVEIEEKFGVCMRSDRLGDYISSLKSIGIEHVVFGYPQNFSKGTIRELAESLFG